MLAQDHPYKASLTLNEWVRCAEIPWSGEMAIKSGRYWVTWANAHASNSNRIADLDFGFRSCVQEFLTALNDAGAKVLVSVTKRDARRAYLMHWSWKIYLGKCLPSAAQHLIGLDIEWDHGDAAASKAGAAEMVSGFQLAIPPRSSQPPSLISHHIPGRAIDMSIIWSDTIHVARKDGKKVPITYTSNPNKNTDLHAVGASYGVFKLKSDAPHWSFNGR